jgi:hypothetical protein
MKPAKKITYRRSDEVSEPYPCIILEGNWITKRYGLKVGDTVGIKYGKKLIVLEMKGRQSRPKQMTMDGIVAENFETENCPDCRAPLPNAKYDSEIKEFITECRECGTVLTSKG